MKKRYSGRNCNRAEDGDGRQHELQPLYPEAQELKKEIEALQKIEELDSKAPGLFKMLDKHGKNIMASDPDIILKLVEKAPILMESTHYMALIKQMVEKLSEDTFQDGKGPLQCLLKVMSNADQYGKLVKLQNTMQKLIQVLILIDSVESRSKFLRVLLTQAEYRDLPLYPRSKFPADIAWTKEFISTVECLLRHKADPTWVPTDGNIWESIPYTAQYRFFCIIPRIFRYKSDLSKAVFAILNLFMKEFPSDTSDQGTPLHALAQSGCELLRKQCEQKINCYHLYRRAINEVIKTDPKICQVKDSDGKTPLQQFIQSIDWKDCTLENIKDIVLLLKSEATLNIPDQAGWTVLHHIAEALPICHKSFSPKDSEIFLDIAKQLTSDSNKNDQDNQGRTVLHVLAEKYCKNTEEHLNKLFWDLIEAFKTEYNIDCKDNHGCTPLHVLVRKVTVDTEVGRDILPFLPFIATPQNVNAKDTFLTTPYSWILKAKSMEDKTRSIGILTDIQEELLKKADPDDAYNIEDGNSFITKYLGSHRQTIMAQHPSRLEKLNYFISIPQRYYHLHSYKKDLENYITEVDELLEELETNYVITTQQRKKIEGGQQKTEDEQKRDLLDVIWNMQEKEKYLAFLEVLSNDDENLADALTGGMWKNPA